MSAAVFYRLLWKEYRLHRIFWLVFLVLALVGQFILGMADPVGKPSTPAMWFIALAASGLYALISGATLYSTEHEMGTYEFQRALPCSAGWLIAGKLAAAVAGIVLLLTALAGGALFWTGTEELPRMMTQRDQWYPLVATGVELFLWGTIFSSLTTRPIVAVFLGLTATALTGALGLWLMDKLLDEQYSISRVRLGLQAILSVASIVLAVHWFYRSGGGGRGWSFFFRSRSPAKNDRRNPSTRFFGPVLGRLLWQSWRQSRVTILCLSVFGLMLTAYAASARHFFAHWYGVPIILLAALMGSVVFSADQSSYRFRFFAEQGVRPRVVWLSRQLLWLAVLLVWIVSTAVVWWFSHGELSVRTRWWPDHSSDVSRVVGWLGCVFLAYTSGQL